MRIFISFRRDKDKTMKINEGNPVATTAFPPESMTTSTGNFDGDSRTTSPLSSTFSIEDCVYRGEGNANIVVALPRVSCKIFFFIYKNISAIFLLLLSLFRLAEI